MQDCFNNLFNCRQNQFFSDSVGPASFRYQQRNVEAFRPSSEFFDEEVNIFIVFRFKN